MNKLCCCVLIVLCLCNNVRAELPLTCLPEDGSEPATGVALSGGGALGLAHIGVLAALEEARIPVTFLAGTSMGAIIGGLYASGLSVSQLEEAALSGIEWDKVFNDKPQRNQFSFREKQNQQRVIEGFEIGLSANSSASGGFITGQKLLLTLKRLTHNIKVPHFDELPIPFRAVAVDLNTAEPYILKRGDLALALTASMALPVVFTPVEIDGHLLVDGGVLNNLPVDVVRDMGADCVIAVNISTPLGKANANSSLLTVAQQSLDVALIQNTRRALAAADLVITPNLDIFSPADFSPEAGQEMIERGRKATQAMLPSLAALQISPIHYNQYRNHIIARTPPERLTVKANFVKFSGQERTDSKALAGLVESRIKGQVVDISALEKATLQLLTLRDLERATYQITKNTEGETGVIFRIQEKAWGPDYFRFGVNASSTFNDSMRFTLLLQHTRLNLNSYGAEWVNEVQLGERYMYSTELYQPLDYNRRYFVAPYARFAREFVDIFTGNQQIPQASYRIDSSSIGADIGLNLSNNTEWRIGPQWLYADSNLRTGDALLFESETISQILLSSTFAYDSLNQRIFPSEGTRFVLSAALHNKSLGADADYQEITFNLSRYTPLFPHLTLLTELRIATVLNSKSPDYEVFSLGGTLGLSGYPTNAVTGHHTLFFQAGGIFRPNWQGLGNMRLVLNLHAGNAWNKYGDVRFKDLLYGGLGGLIIDTRFGSLLMGLGYTKDGQVRYGLSLGNFF